MPANPIKLTVSNTHSYIHTNKHTHAPEYIQLLVSSSFRLSFSATNRPTYRNCFSYKLQPVTELLFVSS